MFQFLIGRLAQSVPVLIGVSLVSFFAIHLVPGDPIQIMTLRSRDAGDGGPAACRARPRPSAMAAIPVFRRQRAAGRSRPLDRPEGADLGADRRWYGGLALSARLWRRAFGPDRRAARHVGGGAPRPGARPCDSAHRHGRLRHAAVLDRARADGAVRPDAGMVSDPRLRRGRPRPSLSYVPAGARPSRCSWRRC